MLDFVGRLCAITSGCLLVVAVQFFIPGETTRGIMTVLFAIIFALLAAVIILLQDKR